MLSRRNAGIALLATMWLSVTVWYGIVAVAVHTVVVAATAAILLLCFALPPHMPLSVRSVVIVMLGWCNDFGDRMTPPKYTVMSEVMGYQKTQLLGIACELRVPDALGPDDKSTAAEICGKLNWSSAGAGGAGAAPQHDLVTRERLLFRIMRALAASGVFCLHKDGTFTHTPTSRVLREDHPESQSAYILAHARINYAPWGKLLDHLRGGPNPMEAANQGQSYYTYLTAHPADNKLLQKKMESIGKVTNDALLRDVQWPELLTSVRGDGPGVLVDVGGGRGAFLRELLASGPVQAAGTMAVLVDEEQVVGLAKKELSNDGDDVAVACRGRLAFTSGNFITGTGIPTGGDTYMLKYVCNDWCDNIVVRIMRNIRAALNPGGRLLVIEQVAPPTGYNGGPFDRSALSDVDMLVINGGAVRTRSQFGEVAGFAGFKIDRVVDSMGITKVVVCVAVEGDVPSRPGVPQGVASGASVADLVAVVPS